MTTEASNAAGIPRALAAARAAAIAEPEYWLKLVIPRSPDEPIAGQVRLDFSLAGGGDWPWLDFARETDRERGASPIRRLTANGRPAPWTLADGHVRIGGGPAPPGRQRIEIDFEAGPAALTRRPDLVYSLFVPARAHSVFPCFDQPDLKARLELELEIPAGWEALANMPEAERTRDGERVRIRFRPTPPLPTYLLAFAAGRLRVETAIVGGPSSRSPAPTRRRRETHSTTTARPSSSCTRTRSMRSSSTRESAIRSHASAAC